MNNNTYFCSPEELKANAKIPFRTMESEAAMYEEIAQIMFDTIQANGDEPTVIICPVGPIGHYPIFAKKVNETGLSLKNCWFMPVSFPTTLSPLSMPPCVLPFTLWQVTVKRLV